MNGKVELVVSVHPDGSIHAITRNVNGPACIDYIQVLEDLLDATTTTSQFTDDYRRASVTQSEPAHNHDDLPATQSLNVQEKQ